VLANILANAVKFTERGEVVVSATVSPEHDPLPASALAQPPASPRGAAPAPGPSARSAPDGGGGGGNAEAGAPGAPGAPGEAAAPGMRIHFTIRDTGIGISADSMKKLFQCFRQGHESMSRKYGGTGARQPALLLRVPRALPCSVAPLAKSAQHACSAAVCCAADAAPCMLSSS
jgi:signal transduction histidine kinase